MNICVVTCPENGWDCVIGVWDSECSARKELLNEDSGWLEEQLVFHQENIQCG